MNIWIIKRNGVIDGGMEVYTYDGIGRDYITTEKATFRTTKDDLDVTKGDFLMAKFPNGEGISYFGVIQSYENRDIVCNDIISLVNFEFPATRSTGPSFELHAKNLINRYLIQDPSKLMDILEITIKSNTTHIYQPSEPPTPTNLMKYLINGFKKYNVVWTFDRFENGKIYTSIESVTTSIRLKNNLSHFIDWDVSTTEVGRGIDNHLLIVNKTTNNSEGPNVLSEWWLTMENTVVNNRNNPLIFKPTKTKVWIYDTTVEDKPTYQEVAESELLGSYYAHEISVKVHFDNQIVDLRKLQIGTLATIYYNDREYKSVLTGYSFDSNSPYATVMFGHIRSRFSELLE